MGESGTPNLLLLPVEPKTPADQERLANGLRTLMREDPGLQMLINPGTGQMTIAARDEVQLEIIVDRLKRDFDVEAWLGRPQIAYKETITRQADGENKYVKQTGGRGHYGHVKIHVYPGDRGTGYLFEDKIVGGAIPKEFIASINEGIKDALTLGVLAGYPIDDVRVTLYDGSYHDVDSSELAFKIAGSMAFQDAAQKAKPVLLEPFMRVEVTVPEGFVADVIDGLTRRRGQIRAQRDRDGTQMVSALAPMSELFGYASDLRSRTRGRATYAIHFDRYEPRPPDDFGGPDDPMVRSPNQPVRPLGGTMARPQPGTPSSDEP